MIIEIILGLTLIILSLVFLFNKHPPKMPPGPYMFPIVGSGNPFSEKNCLAWKEKYGDIYTVKLGKFYYVMLCDYKMAKEILSRNELAARPYMEIMMQDKDNKDFKGLIMSNGKQWVSTRRFVLKQLRDLGMGKSFLEEAVQNEAKQMVKSFEKYAEMDSTELPMVLKYAALNVVWLMVTGKRYEYDNDVITKIDDLYKKFQEKGKLIFMYEFFPILKILFPGKLGRILFKTDQLSGLLNEIRNEIKPFINEHQENKDSSGGNDLISQYLGQIEDPSNEEGLFSEQDLCQSVVDLFNAGSDTVYNTMRWALLFMAKYPEVQKKVQEEIDSVVDRDCLPGFKEKQKLPYTEATIHEVLRQSSLVNFSVVREASEDIQIGDYSIPKGTLFQPASFSIHHDPRYWEDPQEFKPERFINEDGSFESPQEGLIPFGVGRRQCIGETLAKTELYVFLSALLQNFKFSSVEGKEIDLGIMDQLSGRIPVPQKIVIDLRE